jgi:hypothetical protein
MRQRWKPPVVAVIVAEASPAPTVPTAPVERLKFAKAKLPKEPEPKASWMQLAPLGPASTYSAHTCPAV